jgi:hypothetical protein
MFCSGARTIGALRKTRSFTKRRLELRDWGLVDVSLPPKLPISSFIFPVNRDVFMLNDFSARWLPVLESEMRARCWPGAMPPLPHYGMMHYHMGWVDAGFSRATLPAGKRCARCSACSPARRSRRRPAQAVPAAAALEILHNFSLVHDDIEDGDETRRHRATVWKLWGVPQAINVGDAMFALAFAAMQRQLRRARRRPERTLAALGTFTEMCGGAHRGPAPRHALRAARRTSPSPNICA